ncbi:hypothetical protein HDV05_008083 [Chytridiales sp. JEL 0842]|nr:hypothetical protein HDV05_008083 [Chytridiales sp. JEL 0842]
MSEPIVLSYANAQTTFVKWKEDVRMHIDAEGLPKGLTHITTIATPTATATEPATATPATATELATAAPATTTEFELYSMFSFVERQAPTPTREAYSVLTDYLVVKQQIAKAISVIRKKMVASLSPDLFDVYDAEASPYLGFQAVLAAVRFEEASRLQIVKSDLEKIMRRNNETTKQYADRVQGMVREAKKLGYPAKDREVEFEEDLVRRFRNGATSEDRKDWRHLPDTATFTDIRAQIDKDAKIESESCAHRNETANSKPVETNASLFLMQKQTMEMLQAMLNMKSALLTTSSSHSGSSYNDDPNKVFVGGLNATTTDEILKAGLREFGEVVKAWICYWLD